MTYQAGQFFEGVHRVSRSCLDEDQARSNSGDRLLGGKADTLTGMLTKPMLMHPDQVVRLGRRSKGSSSSSLITPAWDEYIWACTDKIKNSMADTPFAVLFFLINQEFSHMPFKVTN